MVVAIELTQKVIDKMAAVLILQAPHLRLEQLHLEHALGALQRERGDQDHHGERDHPDRDGVVVGEAVVLGYEPSGA